MLSECIWVLRARCPKALKKHSVGHFPARAPGHSCKWQPGSRDFAKGVAGTVSLPISSFLPFFFLFLPFLLFFSGSDFFRFFRFLPFHFQKKGETPFARPLCESPRIGRGRVRQKHLGVGLVPEATQRRGLPARKASEARTQSPLVASMAEKARMAVRSSVRMTMTQTQWAPSKVWTATSAPECTKFARISAVTAPPQRVLQGGAPDGATTSLFQVLQTLSSKRQKHPFLP